MSISTHVLDALRGRPAAGVPVRLDRATSEHRWQRVGETVTGRDGRVREQFEMPLEAGEYRLVFDTAVYFAAAGIDEFFFPEVVICFRIADPAEHYHVPLLLGPFSYSTYRGS